MYKVITINGEEYKFEYSVEASLYDECIESITNLMMDFSNVSGGSIEGEEIKRFVGSIARLPRTAAHCFYAGLLEHHGKGRNGDGSVPNFNAAKQLITDMLYDDGNEINDWNDVLSLCLDQMNEDGFFALIGLTDKKPTKVPQDHKKKQPRKVTES